MKVRYDCPVAILLISVFIISPLLCGDPPPALRVGHGERYTSIQEAVDNAPPGATVFVKAGVYRENVVIGKALTLVAKGRVLVVAADSDLPCITILADGAILRGFTVTGSRGNCGVLLQGVRNCTVTDNVVRSNVWGIVLLYSADCEVSNNTVVDHDGFWAKEGETSPNPAIWVPSSGIELIGSRNVVVWGNTLRDNVNGIDLSGSHNNTIAFNKVSRRVRVRSRTRYNNGIGLFEGSTHNTVWGNVVVNYEDAIDLASSSHNVISDNVVMRADAAIGLNHGSNHCLVANNSIRECGYGIVLWDSCTGSLLVNNTVVGGYMGVAFYNSSGNEVVNCTLVDNEVDIYSEGSSNRVVNTTFGTHEEDEKSSLEVVTGA